MSSASLFLQGQKTSAGVNIQNDTRGGNSMPAVPIDQHQAKVLEPQQLKPLQLKDAGDEKPRLLKAFQLQQASAEPPKGDTPTPTQTGRFVFQRKENNTGLPDNLKVGVENMSGFTMDDVKVHYNSGKPAQLQAFAYAQGTDIHIGPGQEKHLPHEAWHVVQQKQGRVQATLQMKQGIAVNDDGGLENEADVMGNKALQKQTIDHKTTNGLNNSGKLDAGVVSEVTQLKQIAYRGINGLTHLVVMTDEGSLYNSEDWLKNEREEVKSGDLLTIDLDDKVFSRRGIDQETNWKQDATGGSKNLWVSAVELNHKKLGADQYVRMEMLSEGTEEIPKKMHSVWVQGDYQENPEAQHGLATRKGTDSEDWVNMIWLYNSGEDDEEGFAPELQTESLKVDFGKFPKVFERSFVDEMGRWKRRGTMPKWVDAWLPILEVLMAKKSYITMSDIMRMIILYYEGGVYMDVKIQVDTKSDLTTAPKLLINTVNFYDRENWAIMANTGCRMIEEIMTRTLAQFPNEEELSTYPENYSDGSGREGRTHAELHENRGVWNIIERYRQHSKETSLTLTNPRPVNSWTNTYDDRDPEIIRAEQIKANREEINKVELKLGKAIEEKKGLEQLQLLKNFPNMWGTRGLTEKYFDNLPDKISDLDSKIELFNMELQCLRNPQPDSEENSDDLEYLMKQLGDL